MENALDVANKTYVDVNIHAAENAEKLASLNTLPTCCVESAEALKSQREYFEAFDVFAPTMIDETIKRLSAFDDKHLAEFLKDNPEQMQMLVNEYLYCG